MSNLGWLTESALIPKPSKKINVDNASIIDLKVAILNEKNKSSNIDKQNISKVKHKIQEKNKGVEERAKRDLESIKSAQDNKQILEKKAQLYEALTKGNNKSGKDYLVDFQQKKIENQTDEEKLQYEQEKNNFYEEQKRIKEEREKNILDRKISGGLTEQIDHMNTERLMWEAEALKEIEEGITEEMIKLRNERTLVHQSYDKKLTSDEKKMLETVLKDEQEQKLKADDIKRKRTELLELRKQKLKKLNDGQSSKVQYIEK